MLSRLKNKDGTWSTRKVALTIAGLTLVSMYLVPLLFQPGPTIETTLIQSGVNNTQQAFISSNITYNIADTSCDAEPEPVFEEWLACIEQNSIHRKINAGDCTSAMEIVDAGLATKEGETDYYLWYAKLICEHNLGNYEAAIDAGRLVLLLNPKYSPAYGPIVSAYYRLNKVNESKEYALKGLELDPENFDLNKIVSWIFYQENDFESALRYASKALLAQPHDMGLLRNKGLILVKLGEYYSALASYLTAEELGDSDAQTYQNLAYIYSQINSLPKTIEYSEKFRKYSNNSTESLCNLDLLYSYAGNTEKINWLNENFPARRC